MSFRSESIGPMGLRIAVIGAQTAAPESAQPYTVYRTVVTYEGQCFERLVRYSEFLWFHKKLKLRKKAALSKAFPKKKWTRKASLEDDVIEARQVMLNEFMREIAKSELAPASEDCLFKLLKIGKYEDGSGRVSELGASFLKSERGDRSARPRGPLDVVYEGDEDGDKRKSTTELAATATLAATSVTFPAVTSNATTVLTEDERSAIGSQSRLVVEDPVVPPLSTERNSGGTLQSELRKSTSSSIPPSTYSEMVLSRPQLKASQSLPVGRRSKHVEFPADTTTPRSASPVLTDISTNGEKRAQQQDNNSLSPEAKYRDRINSHLGTISRLLSESEAETEDMESSHSIQMLRPMPLTA